GLRQGVGRLRASGHRGARKPPGGPVRRWGEDDPPGAPDTRAWAAGRAGQQQAGRGYGEARAMSRYPDKIRFAIESPRGRILDEESYWEHDVTDAIEDLDDGQLRAIHLDTDPERYDVGRATRESA